MNKNGATSPIVKIAIVMSVLVIIIAATVSMKKVKDLNKENYKITVGMVTDVGGINDESFNQSTWEGLKRAEKELGIEAKYLESIQETDYTQNIETLLDEEVDLILSVGFKQTEAIEEAAKNNPERHFAIIDGDFETKEIPSNLKNIMFKEQEAGYLAGILSSTMTKKDNIGFIGGMQIPVVDRYKYGFMAGLKDGSKELGIKDIKIQTQYANSFTDQAKGKAIASQMIKNDADIIFHAAGPLGNGIFEALKEKGGYGIGVDSDQNKLSPEVVITSAIKNLNEASYSLIKEYIEEDFEGGKTITKSLIDNGVGLASYNEKVNSKAVNFVDKFIDKINNKEINVPSTKEEYEEYIK